MCHFCLFPRRKLDQANEKLRKVLIEMIRSTIATEELIGLKINSRAKPCEQATHRRSSTGNKDSQESGLLASDFILKLQAMLCFLVNWFFWISLVHRVLWEIQIYTDNNEMVRFSSPETKGLFFLSMQQLIWTCCFCRYFSCRLVIWWPRADSHALWEPAGFRYSDHSWGRRSSSKCLQQTASDGWNTAGASQPGQHTGTVVLISQQSNKQKPSFKLLFFLFYGIVSCIIIVGFSPFSLAGANSWCPPFSWGKVL